MSTVTNIQPHLDKKSAQRARATFVRDAIAEDDRSDRYIARQIGVAPSTMSERLNGNTPFHPEDLAVIARVLKREPGRFFVEYINAGESAPLDPNVGLGGLEPPASTVECGRLAPVHSFAEHLARKAS